jgi:hypothetical protein
LTTALFCAADQTMVTKSTAVYASAAQMLSQRLTSTMRGGIMAVVPNCLRANAFAKRSNSSTVYFLQAKLEQMCCDQSRHST